ncbi:DUF2971 domain-containing protein [Neisseriaceae bacterium CLB008]
MSKKFYRFRSIDNLFGEYKELERQSIFFAAPDSLNDPMEGFRDIYWKGDYIIWRNLFRHYFRCLEDYFIKVVLYSETILTGNDINVFLGMQDDDFQTTKHAESFKKISETFLNNEYIDTLIQKIASRSTVIRKSELLLYINTINSYAVGVLESHFNGGDSSKIEASLKGIQHILDGKFFENFEAMIDSEESFKLSSPKMLQGYMFLSEQQALMHKYNLLKNNLSIRSYMLLDFPKLYVEQIQKLMYPDWYTACFMTECANSSIWAHYAKNHTGVCLVYEAQDGQDGSSLLSLRWKENPDQRVNYAERSSFQFRPIDYVDGAGEIDFFRSLGRLPYPGLLSTWYFSNDEESICANAILNDEDAWRDTYWASFYRDIVKKTKDWAYENEHRLILTSMFRDLSSPEDRTLTYEFQDLHGLIFGINTSTEDKIKVVKCIEKKCIEHSRKEFEFYQAYYCHDSKSILHYPLSLIKFT